MYWRMSGDKSGQRYSSIFNIMVSPVLVRIDLHMSAVTVSPVLAALAPTGVAFALFAGSSSLADVFVTDALVFGSLVFQGDLLVRFWEFCVQAGNHIHAGIIYDLSDVRIPDPGNCTSGSAATRSAKKRKPAGLPGRADCLSVFLAGDFHFVGFINFTPGVEVVTIHKSGFIGHVAGQGDFDFCAFGLSGFGCFCHRLYPFACWLLLLSLYI